MTGHKIKRKKAQFNLVYKMLKSKQPRCSYFFKKIKLHIYSQCFFFADWFVNPIA